MKFIDQTITDYAQVKSTLPSELCEQIANYTKKNVAIPQMLIGKLEASILGFFIRSLNAKRVLEIGTFTGYSALAMAENLPPNGDIITIDINPKTTQIAQTFWEQSVHGSKIDAKIGSALNILPQLNPSFDLIFIDADKENYLEYLQESLKLLSTTGIVIIDNVLWSGKVLTDSHEACTKGIQRVNDFVARHPQLISSLLPIRDGMLLVQRRQY